MGKGVNIYRLCLCSKIYEYALGAFYEKTEVKDFTHVLSSLKYFIHFLNVRLDVRDGGEEERNFVTFFV